MAEIKLMWDLAQRFCGFVFFLYDIISLLEIVLSSQKFGQLLLLYSFRHSGHISFSLPCQSFFRIYIVIYFFFLSFVFFFLFFCQQDFFFTLLQPIPYLRGCWKRVLFFLHGHHWWDLLHNLPDLKYRRFEKWLYIFENIASRRHVC